MEQSYYSLQTKREAEAKAAKVKHDAASKAETEKQVAAAVVAAKESTKEHIKELESSLRTERESINRLQK